MEVLQRILKAKSYKKRPLDVLEPTFSNFKYPALPLWPLLQINHKNESSICLARSGLVLHLPQQGKRSQPIQRSI
jgi:hypothetical protein